MIRHATRHALLLCATLLLVLSAVGPAAAQGGPGHGSNDGQNYFDPATVVTLSGQLAGTTWDWEMWGNGNHTGGGMGFELVVGSDEYELMLAPAWFLEDNGIVLGAGEQITVTGSQVAAYNGNGHGGGGMMGGGSGEHPYLIVTRIEADGVSLELRDSEGFPLWRGGADWGGHMWFEPGTAATMTGTLGNLQGLWSPMGDGNHTGSGLHYVFASDTGESFYAMLGPWWFMDAQGVNPVEGSVVTLTGSVVESYWSRYSDHRFFVVTDITLGDNTAHLRDEWGYPLWHGTGWQYYSPEWTSRSRGMLSGEVRRTRTRPNGPNLDDGYEIVMRSNGRNYTLFVAPEWHVKDVGFEVHPGDRIAVRGSMVGGASEMVVQYIKVERQRWNFRRRNGTPMWVSGAS